MYYNTIERTEQEMHNINRRYQTVLYIRRWI